MDCRLDKGVYGKIVMLKTANAFTDRAYVHLSQTPDNWIISLTPKEGIFLNDGDFENELISQQLRYELIQSSSELRTILIARAMASTVVVENDSDPDQSTEAVVTDEDDILKEWYTNHESKNI